MQDDEEFLAAILAGDLDPRDPAVVQRLRASPALADRLDELMRVARSLDEEGQVRREASEPASSGEIDFVERVLRSADRIEPSRPRAFRTVLLALAALIVAALGVWGLTRSTSRTAGEELSLDTSSWKITSPRDAWEAGEALAWDYTLPGAGKFRVVVADPDADLGAAPIVDRTTFAPTWTPTSTEFARFPPRVVVSIEVYDADSRIDSGRFSFAVSR